MSCVSVHGYAIIYKHILFVALCIFVFIQVPVIQGDSDQLHKQSHL